MNFKMIFYIIGWILNFEAIFFLLPALIALIYQEPSGWYFLISSAICLFFGILLIIKKPEKRNLYSREGFVIVSLSWIILSFFGSLPFFLSKEIPNFTDALFETISGLTTTGASILSDVESLSHCMLFWRSFTHWIGGMGVLVFIMAFLPLSGAKNIHLMKAESPGPSVSKLVPRVKTTALILYSMYLVLTILELILLVIFRMPLFDALCITFGTAGTGGFGVLNDSIASYSSSVQIIVTVFMALFGVNFNAYFFALCRKWKDIFRNSEIRTYFILIFVMTALIFWNIGNNFSSISEAIKHISFTVVSLITTTGYSTVDFNAWTEFSRILLLLLMLTGACAGSTSGGIKISRFLILIKGMRNGIKKMIHPNQVRHTEMDGKTISKDTVQAVNLYMIFYVFLFIISCIIISLDNYDFLTNFSSVIATLSNVGPGLGQAGPSSNFGIFSKPSKWILMFDMIAGRLELFPVLVLFSPHTWKR